MWVIGCRWVCVGIRCIDLYRYTTFWCADYRSVPASSRMTPILRGNFYTFHVE